MMITYFTTWLCRYEHLLRTEKPAPQQSDITEAVAWTGLLCNALFFAVACWPRYDVLVTQHAAGSGVSAVAAAGAGGAVCHSVQPPRLGTGGGPSADSFAHSITWKSPKWHCFQASPVSRTWPNNAAIHVASRHALCCRVCQRLLVCPAKCC